MIQKFVHTGRGAQASFRRRFARGLRVLARSVPWDRHETTLRSALVDIVAKTAIPPLAPEPYNTCQLSPAATAEPTPPCPPAARATAIPLSITLPAPIATADLSLPAPI